MSVSTADIVTLASHAASLVEARKRIDNRLPLKAATVEQILAVPVLANLSRFRLAANERLSGSEERELVAIGAGIFLYESGVTPVMRWELHARPEVKMEAANVWGLYAVELARRLTTSEKQTTPYKCSFCSVPVLLIRKPKDGDQVYCQRPECQRERKRINKVRERSEAPRITNE